MPGEFAMPSRRPDGAWKCTACDAAAVLQGTRDCDGCQPLALAAQRHADDAAARTAEHRAVMAKVEADILAEKRPATDAEALTWTAARNAAEAALADAGPHRRDAQLLAEPHTHPVFACEAHTALIGVD